MENAVEPGKGRMKSGQIRTHRPYQVAILSTLLDGEPHHKDEMMMAGMRACNPFDALGAYQRAHPEKERMLDSLGGQARMDEALRQQVEGSRMLISKAMSHLVDRALMSVASRDYKGHRETYMITPKGREYVENPTPEGRLVASKTSRQPKSAFKESAQCAFCEKEVFKDDPDTWKFAPAWVKSSSGKGINTARLIAEPTRFAHNACLRDNFEEERDSQPLGADRILKAVADKFGTTPEEILRKPGYRRYEIPRKIAYYFARNSRLANGRSVLKKGDRDILGAMFNRPGQTVVGGARDVTEMLAKRDTLIKLESGVETLQKIVEELEQELA